MEILTLRIDLAKNIYVCHDFDADGMHALQRHSVKRPRFLVLTTSRRQFPDISLYTSPSNGWVTSQSPAAMFP